MPKRKKEAEYTSDFGKELSSYVNDDCPQKISKVCIASQESHNLESKSGTSSKADQDYEMELRNDNMTKIAKNSKSKLSLFIFKKSSKSTDKSSKMALELMEYSQPIYNCHYIPIKPYFLLHPSVKAAISENAFEIASKFNRVEGYTRLEKQYIECKKKFPNAVILIGYGFRYKFLGKDAEIATNDFDIICYKGYNFLSATIPNTRLHYYVKRLVLKGYKVAVVKQDLRTPGDALLNGRYCMYSKSTYIEEEVSAANDENTVDNIYVGSGYLVCINECKTSEDLSGKSSFNIGCVALQVISGDIFYSSFQDEDSSFQNELESFLLYFNPAEIILPLQLSKEIEILIKSLICNRSVTIERLDNKVFDCFSSLSNMTPFFTSEDGSQENADTLLSLPSSVIGSVCALKIYLTDFKLENVFKNMKNMQSFSAADHMILNAATIRSLDILKSSSDSANYRTLVWCLNQTLTKFGERLLKSWIVKPLKKIQKIEKRLNIVTEILYSDSIVFKRLSSLMYKLPDLEKLLCLTFYQKCSCNDFLMLVNALVNLKNELIELYPIINMEIKELKLKHIFRKILKCLDKIEKFHSNIDPVSAKEGNKIKVFLNTSKYGLLQEYKSIVYNIEKRLLLLRPNIGKVLRLPEFEYATVDGQKYLIEVPNSKLSLVPDGWLKISTTEHVSHFRSPEVIKLYSRLEVEQELLQEAANIAWKEFLNEFALEFYNCKCAISYLAELDVYMAFAKSSKEQNFCRPTFVSDGTFHVMQGRHPIVAKLMGEENQFVANDIYLNDEERCLIVTGPNMGGKSTYVRQIALIALMAHIGCFVPADLATIPLLDGIYVRMGADDDIENKTSTFMSEMNEASSILSHATSKSLVIFDELGRGTNDGAAIAFATLKYLIRDIKCLTLFVTHYPTILKLKNYYSTNIITVHMTYILEELAIDDDDDDVQTVTFLYNVVPGISEKNYEINVAALAGISKDILCEAATKSKEMELKMLIQEHSQKLFENLNLIYTSIYKYGL